MRDVRKASGAAASEFRLSFPRPVRMACAKAGNPEMRAGCRARILDTWRQAPLDLRRYDIDLVMGQDGRGDILILAVRIRFALWEHGANHPSRHGALDLLYQNHLPGFG